MNFLYNVCNPKLVGVLILELFRELFIKLVGVFPVVDNCDSGGVSIIIDGFKDFDIHNCPTPMNPISGTLFRTL